MSSAGAKAANNVSYVPVFGSSGGKVAHSTDRSFTAARSSPSVHGLPTRRLIAFLTRSVGCRFSSPTIDTLLGRCRSAYSIQLDAVKLVGHWLKLYRRVLMRVLGRLFAFCTIARRFAEGTSTSMPGFDFGHTLSS